MDASYCLYEPPSTVAKRGVLLYAHGFHPPFTPPNGALDPMFYLVAKAGYYVVLPYVNHPANPWAFEGYAFYPTLAHDALKDAISYVRSLGASVATVSVAGHSIGGMAAARVAAMWSGSPRVGAIILHEPAGRNFNLLGLHFTFAENWITPLQLSAIRCNTHLLIIRAQTSSAPPETPNTINSAALPIWNNLKQIARFKGHLGLGAKSQRNFLQIAHDTSHPTDDAAQPHGYILSDHVTIGRFPPDSMVYYGYWMTLLNGLSRAHTNSPSEWSPYCNVSGTATPECKFTRFMGSWSDTIPASPMLNAADLNLFASGGIRNRCPLLQMLPNRNIR
jgi:pimeloyl-ACP methyl ester carboxylesterase